MVCKRSLYCWKNGPCTSDQARKQIWEDNIRFRESLRSMNQSDHYWSFQISNNGTYCSCIDGQYSTQRQPVHKKFLSGSLQKLDCADCTSITHDLKSRDAPRKILNDEIMCSEHIPRPSMHGNNLANSVLKPDPYAMKNSLSACDLNNNRSMPILTPSIKQKPDEDYPKFCPRYKNTLTNTPLNSSVKFKYSSQPSLLSDKRRADTRNINIQVKSNSPSMDNLKEVKSDIQRNLALLEKKNIRLPKRVSVAKTIIQTPEKQGDKVDTTVDDSQPMGQVIKRVSRNVYTPLSRTTRRSVLLDTKVAPFVTFGCNNSSNDVACKRTHNVLAAPLQVYPSAIQAKHQRRDMIMRFLKTEKDFQRKLLPDSFKKKLINHSSVWAKDLAPKFQDNTTNDVSFNKTVNKIPPFSDNRIHSRSLGQVEAKNSSKPKKVFRRSNSQAHFY